MNEVAETEQRQVFEAELESAELEAINALVDKHKANAAFTQQLALDASRLVVSSQERLTLKAGRTLFDTETCALISISQKPTSNSLLPLGSSLAST